MIPVVKAVEGMEWVSPACAGMIPRIKFGKDGITR